MTIVTDRIDGKPKTIKELFTGRKYGLKYYQREYTWSQANLAELLNDLSGRFLDEYQPEHELKQVASYRPYFLGPIVTAQEDATSFLVDGQQRLTTLTLLLAHLIHLHGDPDGNIRPLIYSKKFGELSFNLDIPQRAEVMHAILENGTFNVDATRDESVQRLWRRFNDFPVLFPADIAEPSTLQFFVEWLLERVVVVEISATDQAMALEMFETMNDRGARLTPTDMLKSYLLAHMPETDIPAANTLWRERMSELASVESTADREFLKAWLRAKYAETMRERKPGAAQRDWENIGTTYQKWVRDNGPRLGLSGPTTYATLVNRDFEVMSRRYRDLLVAAGSPQPGLDHVHYLSWTGFTLQYPVILAAVTPDDDDATFQAKAEVIAGFLERLIVGRIVNYRNYSYAQMTYSMFTLIKEIRDLHVDALQALLLDRIENGDDLDSFDAIANFRLNGTNRGRVRFLLARITAWIDEQCRTGQAFHTYMSKDTKDPYEIEHVWADHPERHPEIENEYVFAETRNRFGGLLLLPKSFNASYGDMEYVKKVKHYAGQNLLARSLHPSAYDHNPSFAKFRFKKSLVFNPHPEEYSREVMDERQGLYRQLAELVWHPDEFGINSTLAEGCNDVE
ncbi:DUF262 domain-containing protein [Williamsia sp. 1135]|uniref:DUF262 domain-containing protein n=1 Tax=Williamsia sp. 1135 TaxID=1889262 RepID=UPI000A10592E|nr:DUF262 domain-containing protein [Williamsia sp. 1135]ORM37132.1 hypothetical protein BFL43_05030 [Williamsia sp. 1135]